MKHAFFASVYSFIKKHNRFMLLLIFLVAFILRFYDLTHIPPGLHGDEAEFGLIAERVIHYQYTSFFSLADTGSVFGFSVLSFWVQGISLMLLGQTIFALRFSSALAGVLTVIIFFLLARLYFTRYLSSILATLALATSHWHIAYSRLAISNIWTPFFMVTILYFFFRGIQKKQLSNFIFAGIFLGLSQYFHYTVKIIPVICLAWSFIYLLNHFKEKKLVFIHTTAFFLTGILVFLPQALYYAKSPEMYTSRIDVVSIFNHLPEYYLRYHVDSVLGVLFYQFINTVKVFNFGGDIGWYIYGYQGGLLAPIAGILAVIGLIISMINVNREKYAFILVWFLLIIIFGGTVTVDAPSSPRLIGVIPAVFLLVGFALDWLVTLHTSLPVILVFLLLTNGVSDYHIYFQKYLHSRDGWAQHEPATQVAYYLQSLGPSWKVYMLRENTWLFFHHGTIKFLDPDIEGVDVDDSSTVIPLPKVPQKNIVYIMPPGSPSLAKLQTTYPKGHVRYFLNAIDHQPSFVSYELPLDALK